MKLLLQILWGWSVLANGAVGIQVGTVQTNNQNIKLMKMNFTSPIWLQSASNVGGGEPVTRFVFAEGVNELDLSANGLVVVKSVQGGEVVRETYSDLDNTYVTINADEGSEVVIYGAVTVINSDRVNNLFTSLDLSKSTALTELNCRNCTGLTSLDLSKSTALTYLACNGCTGLTSLDLSENTALTELACNDCTDLTSLDLSKNTALTELNCRNCTSLTSLDLSENTALTYLACDGCTGLTSINGIAVNDDVSTIIASAITYANSVDGTVTLRQGDEFNQTIIDAAMEKGWDVQYYQ